MKNSGRETKVQPCDMGVGGKHTCATWWTMGIADRAYSAEPIAVECRPDAIAETRAMSLCNGPSQVTSPQVGAAAGHLESMPLRKLRR